MSSARREGDSERFDEFAGGDGHVRGALERDTVSCTAPSTCRR